MSCPCLSCCSDAKPHFLSARKLGNTTDGPAAAFVNRDGRHVNVHSVSWNNVSVGEVRTLCSPPPSHPPVRANRAPCDCRFGRLFVARTDHENGRRDRKVVLLDRKIADAVACTADLPEAARELVVHQEVPFSGGCFVATFTVCFPPGGLADRCFLCQGRRDILFGKHLNVQGNEALRSCAPPRFTRRALQCFASALPHHNMRVSSLTCANFTRRVVRRLTWRPPKTRRLYPKKHTGQRSCLTTFIGL